MSAPAQRRTYTYYHGGPLFTLAELHSNMLLSSRIHALSSQSSMANTNAATFIPKLPQDLEPRSLHPHSIRDSDLLALLSCDLALFTYDGPELDSGTVAEYMMAKFADVPSVILRTDIRGAGDQQEDVGGGGGKVRESYGGGGADAEYDAQGVQKGGAGVVESDAGMAARKGYRPAGRGGEDDRGENEKDGEG
ncbi:hypothetical protein DV736_g3628, partial [Chaetothyriales sp. CBS 134916]